MKHTAMPPGHLRLGHAGLACPLAIVAIPANNEAERIEACLAALAAQRDQFGAPVPGGSFEIVVFANNCADGTVGAVKDFARDCPHPISVVEEILPPEQSNAGWARKRAMDLAANRLIEVGRPEGVILTTDADSVVGSTWLDATMRAFAQCVDAVAGYVDAHPAEMARLGRSFVRRSRIEDHYLRLVAEIYAICDPRSHDPWPNHRVSSGASLAVSLTAYQAIGGLPAKPVGEDAALTDALERDGFKVRHAMDVCVSTSCRFDGRAKGGAADTMRHRHEIVEAPCDDDLEPAFLLVARALWRGRLRRLHERRELGERTWAVRLGMPAATACTLSDYEQAPFTEFWSHVVQASPKLSRRQVLRPSALVYEISRAEMCLAVLRRQRPPVTKNENFAVVARHDRMEPLLLVRS